MRLLAPIAGLLLCSCAASDQQASPAALAANQPMSRFAPVEDGAIHFRAAGEGPPLVLLHGGGMDMSMWDALVPALSRHHRVVRWDARGHGASTAPPDPSRLTAHDLRSLLDHLQIPRATIVGFSMGAGTAANFAILSPERVERLILISTAAPPPGVAQREGAPPSLAEPEGRRLLAKTSVPTLMVVGSEDSALIRATGSAVEREVRSARLLVLENASHHVIAERPAEVAAAILRWTGHPK